ncbi:pancreatic lipase-related protein 2 [Echinops telfairi]|uniref:Triacylglycerol lipase n=1 Tax=Echinops telfairi TaxID=9371 RepID=A0ABM0IJE2_ECHTE|nr:pancreatic lipase-related protein 2 [Echinops telfairi]
MLSSWILSFLLLATVQGKEICFGHLGCFSNEKPWAGTFQRPLKLFPQSPKAIDTRFLLYTNENQNNYQRITATDPNTINGSNFQADRKTRFIIHGFIDKGEENWLSDMCKPDLLSLPLQTEMGHRPENVHLIGHSLGSHAAGEAGRRMGGRLGRITGLDPAEPCFQGTPEEVRLDPSDAMFVDVIHTDAAPIIPFLGFGMSQKVGHLDFFPNGGEHMPGCQKNILSTIVDINGLWEGTRDFVACNHLRSYKYYSNSITTPDGFLGYPCASYDKFQENGCFPCPHGGCPQMGHYADQFKGKTSAVGQAFFLNTGDSANFARWRYRVSVKLTGKRKVSGYFRIALYGSNGNSKQYQIFKGSLLPDARHTLDIDVDLNVGKLEKVKFLWNNHVINLLHPTLGASQITVQSGEEGTEYKFCGSGTVQEDVLQSLYPC